MTTIKYFDSYDLSWQLLSFLSGSVIGDAVYSGAEICGIEAPYPTILGWLSGLGVVLLLSILPMPIYLYVRHDLQTPISIADARQLERLFPFPLAPKKCRPHSEVLQLPREQRREYLFRRIRSGTQS